MFYTQEIEIYRILLSFSLGAIAVSMWNLLSMDIPDNPVYSKIKTARTVIVIDYITILLINTADLIFVPKDKNIPLLFLTIGMFQTAFIGYALATLASTIIIKWSRLAMHTVGILSLFILNICCLSFFKEYTIYCITVTLLIYFFHLGYYSVKFFKSYNETLFRIKDYLAEEEETRMTWVKNNFIALIILSILAACTIINEDWFYQLFIVSYIIIYSYIAIEFVKRNHKYSKVLPTVVDLCNKEQEIEEDRLFKEQRMNSKNGTVLFSDFPRVALELDRWISNKGFLKSEVTIDQILNMLDTTRPTLRAFMKKIYGMTFSEWRNELRLDSAYSLLQEHPEHTLGTVAKMVGFNDEKNFEIAFRKKYAMSPKEVKDNKDINL